MDNISKDKTIDIWEEALENQIKILQDCQSNKNLNSCFDCDSLLDCTTRKNYIKAVYESMNKGTGGGFEF